MGGGGWGGASIGIGTKIAGGSIGSGHAVIVNQQYDPEDHGQCPRSMSCLALLDPFPTPWDVIITDLVKFFVVVVVFICRKKKREKKSWEVLLICF